jgi:phosphatidylinositol alpha-1,6-mannosyltransferase
MPHRAAVAALNALAVADALRWRPDFVVSAHIVTAPAAVTINRLLGTPWLQYSHGRELASRPDLARFAVTRAHANVAVSSFTAARVGALGADPGRVFLVSPGADTASRREVPRYERPTVATVARLTERYKGFDVMLRAMPLVRARVPDAQWLVMGDGPLRESLERTATVWGLEGTVTFLGRRSAEERDELLDRAHVFAMPSRLLPSGEGGEGFGIVYLEAALHELPSVAGNVGGATDAVVDGETGALVDPTDHLALADALTGILSRPDHRDILGVAAAERARRFTWQAMAERVEEIALETLAGPGHGR